ncbi:MAG TPA: site-specific integrase, partial [Myxococcota bacterium]|nr:site-specific integrase [Myxococcota bacterium]
MEACVERYLEVLRVERNLSPHTVEAYQRDLRGLIASLAASDVHDAADARAVHLTRWLRSLAGTGKSPASQGRALSAARQLFAFLVREGEIATNPVAELTGPKRRRPLPVVPSRQEMVRLVEAPGARPAASGATSVTARFLRDRAALELLYAAGLRASELCRLRLDELHTQLGVVRP